MEGQSNENSTNLNIYFFICHYCKKTKKVNEVINCTGEDCKEIFCENCITKIFSCSFQEIKEEYENNGWICFKCRNLCKCNSCILNSTLSNENYSKNDICKSESFTDFQLFNDFDKNDIKKLITKNNINFTKNNEIKNKNSKIDILDLLNDKKFIEKKNLNNNKEINELKKEEKIIKSEKKNEKNIVKKEENTENSCCKITCDASLIESLCKGYKPKCNPKEMKFPFIPSQNKIPNRLKSKLIKIAKLCEHYYRHKCKCEYFKKNCLICNKPEHHTNELLRFKNSDDFINYLRYIYLCMNDVVDYIHQIFSENKEELLEFYRNYEKDSNHWSFKLPKILCKLCIFQTVNKKNALNTFKYYLDDNFYRPDISDSDHYYRRDFSNNKKDNVPNNKTLSIGKKETLEKIVFPQKTYEELESILFNLLTNIYKFILVIYSLNENRYRNLFTFLNQDFKVYYENLIQLKKEIETNLDLFSEFQKQHQNKINDFIAYYYKLIPKETSVNLLNNLLFMKIENNNFCHKIAEVIIKFINNSYKYLEELSKLSNI